MYIVSGLKHAGQMLLRTKVPILKTNGPLSISSLSWIPQNLQNCFDIYKKDIQDEYENISKLISTGHPDSRLLSRRWNELKPLVGILEELDLLTETDAEIECMVKEIVGGGCSEEDGSELSEIAKLELEQRKLQRSSLEQKLIDLMVPVESQTMESSTMLELFAGAGGREAGLFARELLEMYRLLAAERKWNFNLISESTMTGEESTESGSESPLLNARVEITCLSAYDSWTKIDCLKPLGVYGQLCWEAGVHRVQRIPVTSKQQKIHTSTVAVSVTPVCEDIDVEIPASDLKWDYFRASGSGGQHVNKTDSAVRLTHLPTGIVVACQKERNQLSNKRMALENLKNRLKEDQMKSHSDSIDSIRRSQIGNLDRSEKIRTYNFQQDRITDHRLGRSWNGIHRFMRQTIGLSEAIEQLALQGRVCQIRKFFSKYLEK